MENTSSTSSSNALTIDRIIEKFIPVIGAIFVVVWLGYLLYTSVWLIMPIELKLWLGFFLSLAIIGWAFSFSDKLKYFADVVMGWGILLLYATLIYGSRTTDLAVEATIPEVATLVTAFIFTLSIAYFASFRKSKVILALGMLGAYLTPFFIGQNDTWVQNISFNAYLMYFAAINIVIFVLGKELATHDLIPINLLGLFFGTSTLYHLSYTQDISLVSDNFFTSHAVSAILFLILVVFAITSIAFSSRHFAPKDEPYIALGYLFPLLWFFINITRLWDFTSQIFVVGLYLALTAAYFVGWNFVRKQENSRYQHLALYVGWTISVILAVISLFPEFDAYTSILIAYVGLVFGIVYLFDPTKGERFLTYILLSFLGAIFAFGYIYDRSSVIELTTIFAVIALVPAILSFPIARLAQKTPKDMLHLAQVYSVISTIIAVLLILWELLTRLDALFMFFILPAFLIVLYASTTEKLASRGALLRFWCILLWIGFIPSFLFLVSNLAPNVANNEHFWKDGGIFTNWHTIKAVFALMTLFMWLSLSRKLQIEQKTDRPSFLLVIFWYATLLLLVNFSIITFANDLWIEFSTGWIRAIATTFWWIVLALIMLVIGIQWWHMYRSEKLLGLLLLVLTIAKIGLYDLSAMDSSKKTIVLIVVGIVLMTFSYVLQTRGLLKDKE
jgi:hypothetical protein